MQHYINFLLHRFSLWRAGTTRTMIKVSTISMVIRRKINDMAALRLRLYAWRPSVAPEQGAATFKSFLILLLASPFYPAHPGLIAHSEVKRLQKAGN